jgi:hypothetical protein
MIKDLHHHECLADWNALMEHALALRKCHILQSTGAEAPGLLAYVELHLGAHHSPDLSHVQHELSKAASAPLAGKQWAAAKAVITAEETLQQAQGQAQRDHPEPQRRGPGRSPSSDNLSGAGPVGGRSHSPRAPTPRTMASGGRRRDKNPGGAFPD